MTKRLPKNTAKNKTDQGGSFYGRDIRSVRYMRKYNAMKRI
jgi:hypothetical protein